MLAGPRAERNLRRHPTWRSPVHEARKTHSHSSTNARPVVGWRGTLNTARAGDKLDKWSKLPESVVRYGRDEICIVMYAAMDLRQGSMRLGSGAHKYSGGVTALAALRGMQERTVRTHLEHLEADGWVHIERPGGQKAWRIYVLSNPARWKESVHRTPASVPARAKRVSRYASAPQDASVALQAQDNVVRGTRQPTCAQRTTEPAVRGARNATRPRSIRSEYVCEQCGYTFSECSCPFVDDVTTGEKTKTREGPVITAGGCAICDRVTPRLVLAFDGTTLICPDCCIEAASAYDGNGSWPLPLPPTEEGFSAISQPAARIQVDQ